MAVWLTGTVWMAVVATQNFYTIERLFDGPPNPAFTVAVNKLGEPDAHYLLKYLSSELNRLFFQSWGIMQIGVGILALWFVVKLPNAGQPKWMIVAMLAISLLFLAAITPKIVTVGRSLDFVAHQPPPPALRTFGLLHAAYTVLDGIKLILGIIATIGLVRVEK
jgi:hypothetical protein